METELGSSLLIMWDFKTTAVAVRTGYKPSRRFRYFEATEPSISLFLLFYAHERPSPFFIHTPQKNRLLMINDQQLLAAV